MDFRTNNGLASNCDVRASIYTVRIDALMPVEKTKHVAGGNACCRIARKGDARALVVAEQPHIVSAES